MNETTLTVLELEGIAELEVYLRLLARLPAQELDKDAHREMLTVFADDLESILERARGEVTQ